MSDPQQEQIEPASEGFAWHPVYANKSYAQVERSLVDDIRRDQHAYQLLLDHAEKEEYETFNSVRDLEKRWSTYDFGWAEVPADTLAAKILEFERAREDRQEMISWNDWRSTGTAKTESTPETPVVDGDWRTRMTDEQRKKLASALAILVILGFVLACFGLYAILR